LSSALERLGLDSSAKASDVRLAYRRLSLEHHPDRVQDPDGKLAAQRRFMKIRDAYEFLRKRPQLLRGFQPAKPGGGTAAAPDSVEASIDKILRRYRELHAVRPSPAAEFLRVYLDHWIPVCIVWALYIAFVAALIIRPSG
jgi:curved DNA-binding protein CbpA